MSVPSRPCNPSLNVPGECHWSTSSSRKTDARGSAAMSSSAAVAFLEVPNRVPDRRHSSEQTRAPPQSLSHKTSSSSVGSHKSEPGWLTTMNGVDRSRATSVPTTATKSPSGFSKLFGLNKPKKEKKDMDQIVLTSRHAAAVKTKLALDPKIKNVRRDSAPVIRYGDSPNSLLVPAQAQEMRHPHSGPPALSPPSDKADMPMLTRIVSGDEADELDEWEQLREQWKQRKMPTLETEIIEGQVLGAEADQGSMLEEKPADEVEIPPSQIVEHQGVRLLAVAGVGGADHQPRPERRHTPIGGRWKKDDKGIWKR